MKEFINKLEIAPAADIDSISGTTLTMKTDREVDIIYTKNDITPDEQGGYRNANRYYSVILNVICDKLATAYYNKYRDRKVVVKLFSDQDEEFLLGNLNFPARCSMEPKLNSDVLSITCESPDPLVS